MAQQGLLKRVLAAINGEYERRIRAASLVTEYGAGHGHGHHDDHHADHHEEDEGDAAEILNVPLGTRRPNFDH
ncbi:hypothetical protein [Candidatus Oscillochloris fontis]|uniref:hypothetical protein n=1 Tax=Candidatus Oscillochloris fontis TaxID=2496868 RepID=UPI00101CEFE2|nr:hypothetical protein [Candidatus Oscillochloris fontis]